MNYEPPDGIACEMMSMAAFQAPCRVPTATLEGYFYILPLVSCLERRVYCTVVSSCNILLTVQATSDLAAQTAVMYTVGNVSPGQWTSG